MKKPIITTTTLLTLIIAVLNINSCKEDFPVVELGKNNLLNIEISSTAIGGNYCEIHAILENYSSKIFTETGVCWGINTMPTINENKNTATVSGGTIMLTTINGLLPSTKYYVRGYAIYNHTAVYNNQIEITTTDGLPTLTTNSITSITATTASSGGSVNADGGFAITPRGVCWSISSTPTIADNKTTDSSG